MGSSEVPEYLCVDGFLSTLLDSQALKSALDLGLIDQLRDHPATPVDELEARLGCDGPGLRLLVDLLVAGRVVETRGGKLSLTREFLVALRYRDLLKAKIDFAGLVAPDLIDLFPTFFEDPERFRRSARVFGHFAYDRCFERSPENYERTRRWMRVTTALTRYEAGVCMQHYDFARHERMLDVGGNSGEFALRVCREHPGIRATVYDLPLVCDVGREHVFSEPEAERIGFAPGNALEGDLPSGFDLVTFKSVLHDWPDDVAKQLLSKASRSLEPGGTLLVFERGPIRVGGTTPAYSMIPFLLFVHSFRGPSLYEAELEALGFHEVEVRSVELETAFFLLTAKKPGSPAV